MPKTSDLKQKINIAKWHLEKHFPGHPVALSTYGGRYQLNVLEKESMGTYICFPRHAHWKGGDMEKYLEGFIDAMSLLESVWARQQEVGK